MEILTAEALTVIMRMTKSLDGVLIRSEALFWSLTALDSLLVLGRFVMRWRRLRRIRVDDALNGVALIFPAPFYDNLANICACRISGPAICSEYRQRPTPPSRSNHGSKIRRRKCGHLLVHHIYSESELPSALLANIRNLKTISCYMELSCCLCGPQLCDVFARFLLALR